MNDIEKKQIFLIQQSKRYFSILRKKKIDISKSSFCYLSSYGINPGQAKLLLWLKKKNSLINYFKIIFKHILAISSFQNYILSKNIINKSNNLFLTWGRNENFKDNYFFDNFLKTRSDKFKSSIFFVIYLDNKLPKKIPKNVILFYKKDNSRSILFLLKKIFLLIFRYNFNIIKIFHYLSSQTIFAEIINDKILSIDKHLNFKKIIMPYEGQPYQNYIINSLNKKISNFQSIGIIHSILPALPLNLIKREGSPKIIYVSGYSQKKILTKHLGWKDDQIFLTKSLRLNKNLDRNILGSVFFPINLENINKIVRLFENFLLNNKKKSLPLLKIRNHPQMKHSKKHQLLELKLNKLFNKYRSVFNSKLNNKICLFIGTTSAVIEYLEKKVSIIHIPIHKEFDIYTTKIWRDISIFDRKKVFYYETTKKNKLVKLSEKSYSFSNLNIL